MVKGLACSKNLSKMKSLKSSGRSRRNRYCVSRDHRSKSPLLEPLDWRSASDNAKLNYEGKTKTKGKSVRRSSPDLSPLKCKDPEQASSSSKSRPGILYSDVLFSGENASTLVKIKGLTPRQVTSHGQIAKSHSRSRKRATHRDKMTDFGKESKSFNQAPDVTEMVSLEKKNGDENSDEKLLYSPPKNVIDLTECTKHLMTRLNIELPLWNFTEFGTFNDIPKFVCQFDDYNYLACEKVAFVGLRLASDGKFKS